MNKIRRAKILFKIATECNIYQLHAAANSKQRLFYFDMHIGGMFNMRYMKKFRFTGIQLF